MENEQKEKERTITMTFHELFVLSNAIATATGVYKREAKSWEESATEVNPDGTPRFQHAENNGKYYRKMIQDLDSIKKKIEQW